MGESLKPAPIGLASYARTWLASCVRSVGRSLMRRNRRTPDAVMQEYDANLWNDILRTKRWTRSRDLAAYFAGENQVPIVAYVDGVVCRIATDDYYARRVGGLARLLADVIGPADEIVELGCGYGYNLLSLASAWPNAKFTGLDFSPNAIQAAKEIATHFGFGERITFDLADLTNPNHPNLPRIRGRSVFTFYCIEQIPYEVSKVVENILAQRPGRVVHVEPGTALLNWWNPRDWPEFLYLRSVDYQNDLYSVLRRFEQDGRIRILHAMRSPFAPSIQNRGLVVAWEPTEKT